MLMAIDERVEVEAGVDGGFGVYVHWPFCQSKCPYCDFNSHVRHTPIDQTRYAAAMRRELATMASWTADRRPVSVFFGGGTPSLMEPSTVGAILEAIDDTLGLPSEAEISLEANPSSVEQARFEGYRAAGVNRVSLGVQSLNDAELVTLGRRHDVATARAALALAQRIFPRVSADLIYARPGQTTEAWAAELSEMLSLCGNHLSLYQLTIEPETRYWDLANAGKLVIPNDDLAADLYELTGELTRQAGFERYEVSNHARDGETAKHNLVYWRGGRYLGIGPGAHGRVAVDGIRTATATLKRPEDWLDAVERDGHGAAEREPLAQAMIADEYLLMALRLSEGLDLDAYAQRSGHPLDPTAIDDLAGAGLVQRNGRRIRIAESARLLTNAIVRELTP
ncbi:radical SAM family heme chaperone HemW [Acuticoccus sp. M5D2P5]|uniref:radical SAM family heme chaperone HemW n=1 Tax=Acuticoccus kalidii TaxID=2910977 RepID=UPI001F31217F|nr:radical SAM family heme chaperone HemW [Acuticoccus kalidii]MCF3933958.1 radical SAM family heme chaperone HemW [Acuticoccus kalidii]